MGTLHNLIKDKFPSLFENVVLGSLKVIFINWIIKLMIFDISFYLTEVVAFRHCRELIKHGPDHVFYWHYVPHSPKA